MTSIFIRTSLAILLIAAIWGCTQSKRIEDQHAKDSGAADNTRLAEQVTTQIKSAPSIPESREIDRLVAEGVAKSITKKGRQVDVFIIQVPNGTTIANRSSLKDLPEVVELRTGSTVSHATLGWNWQTRLRTDGNLDSDPPPIGALLRLEDILTIGQTKLSKGTLLQYTGNAWVLISPNDARTRITQILVLPDQLKEGTVPDAREAGALGAILLGEQSMVPDLLVVAKRNDNVARYACVSLTRIGDSSVVGALGELATLHASEKDVAAELLKAIDRLKPK